eukprot:scaffold80696_cov23-Tisochrysis_lutea.AAC.3
MQVQITVRLPKSYLQCARQLRALNLRWQEPQQLDQRQRNRRAHYWRWPSLHQQAVHYGQYSLQQGTLHGCRLCFDVGSSGGGVCFGMGNGICVERV